MNKKLIKDKYKEKIKLIRIYNQKYYNENQPEIHDDKYDELKKEILLLEKKYSFLKSKTSPSKSVGYKPSKSFKKSRHRVPMLSLSNAFNEDDLLNFEKKILNFLSKSKDFKISYTAEPKIDGISASLTYKDGKLDGDYERYYKGELRERSTFKNGNKIDLKVFTDD